MSQELFFYVLFEQVGKLTQSTKRTLWWLTVIRREQYWLDSRGTPL